MRVVREGRPPFPVQVPRGGWRANCPILFWRLPMLRAPCDIRAGSVGGIPPHCARRLCSVGGFPCVAATSPLAVPDWGWSRWGCRLFSDASCAIFWRLLVESLSFWGWALVWRWLLSGCGSMAGRSCILFLQCIRRMVSLQVEEWLASATPLDPTGVPE